MIPPFLILFSVSVDVELFHLGWIEGIELNDAQHVNVRLAPRIHTTRLP